MVYLSAIIQKDICKDLGRNTFIFANWYIGNLMKLFRNVR